MLGSTTRQWIALAALLAMLAPLGGPDASAQDDGPLAVQLLARKIVRGERGKEVRAPADDAGPGDTIEYVAIYTNRGAETLAELKPVLPVPEGMVYVAGTAEPAPDEASLDGQRFAAIPIKRVVARDDGTTHEEEVPPSAYRALRWDLGDLAAGATTAVRLRARVVTRAGPQQGQ